MNYYKLQIISWDDDYFAHSDDSYKIGDEVLIETDWGEELAHIVSRENNLSDKKEEKFVKIIKKITKEIKNKIKELNAEENDALHFCSLLAKKNNLAMKIVAAHFSLNKNRLVFAFIAQGRVDFRELLRDLTKKYNNNIRLQQIGVRDEVRLNGDIGSCGLPLCCQTCLRELGNVTTDMADKQKISGRGMEKLSGICGRLKCCLAFEVDDYDKKNHLSKRKK